MSGIIGSRGPIRGLHPERTAAGRRGREPGLGRVQERAADGDDAEDAGREGHDDPDQGRVGGNLRGEVGCDLILMASHGRKGISALVFGSETKIPVLVCR